MKPVKATPKIINSKTWIRINYISVSMNSVGYMIMKKDAYEDNRKKFDKLFKDVEIVNFIDDYHVTMKDIVKSAIRTWEHRLSQINARYIDYQRRFGNRDGWTQDAYITMMEISDKIKRLKRKVKTWKDYQNYNV